MDFSTERKIYCKYKNIKFSLRNFSKNCRFRANTFSYKEPDTLDWIDTIDKDTTFLDIGANSGYFSFYLANKFKNLKVKAYEPNLEAFEKFKKTLIKNSFENIEIFNYGLSDIEKKVKMITWYKHGHAKTNSVILEDNHDINNSKIFDTNLKVGDQLFNFKNKKLTLIDTAGMRRKRSIKEETEKFSVSKSVESIKRGDLVILLLDGSENIVDQDIHLLGLTLAIGRPVLVVANKIDLLDKSEREGLENKINRKLKFASYIKLHYI